MEPLSPSSIRPHVAAIRTVSPADTDGDAELTDAYREALVEESWVPHIYQVQSLHVAGMVDHVRLHKTLMFGPSPLSRVQRELVATVVSRDNECRY